MSSLEDHEDFEREVTLMLRAMGVCPWCQSQKSKFKSLHDAKARTCLGCNEVFYLDARQDSLSDPRNRDDNPHPDALAGKEDA